MLNDYMSATKSNKRALYIRQKILGEDHEKTADSYFNLRTKSYANLGITQYMLKDNTSATESHMQALNIRQKVLGDDRENTIYSHFNLGITQFVLKDNNLTQVTQASTKHQTKRNWVKIMRTPLTATSTWGLPNICLRITPQPLSHTNEH